MAAEHAGEREARSRSSLRTDRYVTIPSGQPRLKVLSIVGPGRSGTTVFGRILGEVTGIVDAGELYWEWRRGVLERRPCGCGESQLNCPVWSRVVPRALRLPSSGVDDAALTAAAKELVRARAEVDASRHLLRVLRSATSETTTWVALQRLRDVTAAVCVELAQVSGATVVVDTSKRAQDAAILAGSDALDHYVLQMVRDPRAVAHSWRRAKPLPGGTGLARTMATRSWPLSAARWAESCLGAEVLRRYVPPQRWHFLRYEDFVARPRDTVQEVLDFIGHDAESPVGHDGTVVLGRSHTVAGNPDRFQVGAVRIRPDDEWLRRMPLRDQMAVGVATAPLSRRYAYSVVPRPRGSGAPQPSDRGS